MRVRGEVIVAASLDATWRALADIASHVDWMADAESIRFTSEQRDGAGTTFECRTRVGPLTTTDRMTVTSWKDRREIGVAHTGIVAGSGRFELTSLGPDSTQLTWTEDLRFPRRLGGPIAAWAARPVLRRLWMGNLRRFRALVEQANH